MQPINNSINRLHQTLNWASSYCTSLDHVPAHKIPRKPDNENDLEANLLYEREVDNLRDLFRVQRMVIDGVELCPRCKCEEDSQNLKEEVKTYFKEKDANKKRDILLERSILLDEDLKNARFTNYKVDGEPLAASNARQVYDYANAVLNGEHFNIFIYGPTGVGKSHLGYSFLNHVVEKSNGTKSALFIDFTQMLSLVQDSFNNKNSIYTQVYFSELLASVDVLLIDDLGAETGGFGAQRNDFGTPVDLGGGRMVNVKRASDYTVKILTNAANSRQNKTTIITTNVSGAILNAMYDQRTISRLSKNRKVVIFDDSVQDKRPLEGY